MTNLKECPFCGSDVILINNENDFMATEKRFGIHCKKCGMYVTFYPHENKVNNVITRYNRRSNDTGQKR